ncbi:nicotinamide n-methyltransferase, partial [Cladochytrium tenue]
MAAPSYDPRDVEVDPDEILLDADLFAEPEGFRPPTPPGSDEVYERVPENVEAVSGRTGYGMPVSFSPVIWMPIRVSVAAKGLVLELGAAAAVPSLIAALNGAEKVVITDWPDPGLIKNI